MSLMLKMRDLFVKPDKVLREAEIKEGDVVLDFGCGPGNYALEAAKMVGEKGKVYALDLHPMACDKIKEKAIKYNLNNLFPIQSDGKTDLKDASVDIVLLYYVLHHVEDKQSILQEMHRILKPNAILSYACIFEKKEVILSSVTDSNLFEFEKKQDFTYTFRKK